MAVSSRTQRGSKGETKPLPIPEGLDDQTLLKWYRQMLLIRRFELEAARAYGLGKIGGFLHLYIGQEATGVGAIAAIREDDYVVSAYRDHGHALLKGIDPKVAMAELYGKVTGCCRGKGGSMHFFDYERRFLGGYAIVGGQIPIATGVGLKIKYTGGHEVVLCFFGEGAINQGAFHESMNLAELWKLPVVYICENNRYAMGTPLERASSLFDLSQKACAYNMARAVANGMDVFDVYSKVSDAVRRAREESLPTLIEARTYRFRGHSMSDPAHYRTKEELEEQMKNDPLVTFPALLKKMGILTDELDRQLQEEVKAEIQEAVDFAEQSPEPDLEELYRDVYVEG
ncbi:MAG: pyruvate dehydrogenase (acetyl-transferring) E1 component subunit alpha [candidate division KSB1 bacterium]|nr:pyruvate dehydrogenase (acetyl-transferring) E1 component subunit alpha [candidate division KSB1 bacterium]